MSRFIPPFADVGKGITPSSGAKYFFFESNTSTPKNTYSDKDLTTPNTNPVISDSNGLFPDIWLETGEYKVRLTDNNDIQKHPDADPVGGVEAGGVAAFNNVTDMQAGTTSSGFSHEFVDGERVSTGKTLWRVTATATSIILTGGSYAKAIGDVYMDEFNDSILTDSQMVHKANDYCQDSANRNRLVFENKLDFDFEAADSFIIYVEGGGWFCADMCALRWNDSPTEGFAVNIQGRYTDSTGINTRLNDSNFRPMEGFTIGASGQQRLGVGLKLGYADAWQSAVGAVITSKWVISRINVFEFDDVIEFWTGTWACELHRVNTIGGSWKTPSFFVGLDYGENIKLNDCFIADNHIRLVDGEPGSVVFSAGEFVLYGGSFDNMKVEIAGDATVKMFGAHFENPFSTAKNKRFLEVTGLDAYCVLESPTIVIRNTVIYSNLFYCVAGTPGSPKPYAGGLVINNPSYNSNELVRPDLASRQGIVDATTYDGDDYLELVGGGGRIYCSTANINSLFVNFNPIPISRNLVGKSIYNHSFDIDALGASPTGWVVDAVSPFTGLAVISDDYAWVGTKSLKTTADYNGGATFNSSKVHQDIDCKNGNFVIGNIKLRWDVELTNGATGPITGTINIELKFIDRMGNEISSAGFKTHNVTGNSAGDTFDWFMDRFTATAPAGTDSVRLEMVTFSTSDSADKKIHTYWDTAVFNVL